MKYSKTLEDTALWKVYKNRISEETGRIAWVKKVYETAVVYLNDVRQTFINYTLHDGTHVLNVMDAMGGLLGNRIENLATGEVELLILAASLHDLGMVYTEEEKKFCFEDETACKAFLREHCPELMGCEPNDWPEDIQQWYLRILHPFRLSEVLQNNEWNEIIEDSPNEIVPMKYIRTVCQAHGEDPEELRGNRALEYLPASDTDPLFCALLLRLADLLDFDDTRAPKVLYSYVTCNEKSREEWDKHQASAGFRYPDSPSMGELPYKACCKNPMIEHAVRDFLDWIDDELGNCVRLQRYCNARWQNFPFPRAVSRKEIESDGYMSGDFCLTMDQTRIMNLMMGENLYNNRDVFVRELLQNAIDATLLRSEMDSDFMPEKSRIDLWEWNDKEGNYWFRIDDYGTGMTLGMVQKYFLKVGNSYYISQELERDLRDHGQTKQYQGISRFGIGFLSCFLCGEDVEVSTLYFDSQKNLREESSGTSSRMTNFGLRFHVTGLTGYYTLKSQADKHPVDSQLPMPDGYMTKDQSGLERGGYRGKPGTSIVICLNPGKLGAMNLRETVEKYLCGARVPVYYNNERVGKTYEEMMHAAHQMAGEKLYELTPELKDKFDDCFPAIHGQYPKLAVTVVPLDTEEEKVLPNFSGVLVKYDVRFEHTLQWKEKDQTYEMRTEIGYHKGNKIIQFCSFNSLGRRVARTKRKGIAQTVDWNYLETEFGVTETANLGKKLETLKVCPQTKEQLGEVWLPFSERMDLNTVWTAYHNYHHEKFMSFDITECGCPVLSTAFGIDSNSLIYSYQGIIAGREDGFRDYNAIFLLDKEWKPDVEISRSKILNMPLEILITICGIFNKHKMLDDDLFFVRRLSDWKNLTLQEWRAIRMSPLGQWVNRTQESYFEGCKQAVQECSGLSELDNRYYNHLLSSSDNYSIFNKFLISDLQDSYSMKICYEKGQIIKLCEKTKDEYIEVYNIFPPMMFCKADSVQSRKYICHAIPYFRKGITVDHPVVIWLLDNAFQLNQYFQWQFKRIVDCFCDGDADNIIREFNALRQQLTSLTERHGVDISSLPQLSMDDFWTEEVEECPF